MTIATTAPDPTLIAGGRYRPTVHASTSAASVVEAVKIYGSGDQQVHALDGVSVDFATRPIDGDHGPVGLGQVDPDAQRRRSRHAHVRIGPNR